MVKLDRSLLAGICQGGAIETFYRDLVELLKNLGNAVVAEGVETEREVERLTQWNVDYIQGYYFSRPLPPEQAAELLEKCGESHRP